MALTPGKESSGHFAKALMDQAVSGEPSVLTASVSLSRRYCLGVS